MLNTFHKGCALFRDQGSQKSYQQLFTEDLMTILQNNQQWWLCLGEYELRHWKTIFAMMLQTSVLKIQLGRNLNSHMIEQLNSVKFIQLRCLCFGKNNIENLQMLQNINAPLIEWLSFEQNYITQLRSLRKAYFPNLKVLNLKSNRIRCIELFELNAPQLEKICIEFFHTNSKQGESMSWALKLQTSTLSILRCRSQHRIFNPSEIMILRRFPNINLKKYDPNQIDDQQNSQSDHQ